MALDIAEPIMTWGTCLAGFVISSAICAALSKPFTATEPGSNPSIKTTPLESQPVRLTISVNTKLADCLGCALDSKATRTKKAPALIQMTAPFKR